MATASLLWASAVPFNSASLLQAFGKATGSMAFLTSAPFVLAILKCQAEAVLGSIRIVLPESLARVISKLSSSKIETSFPRC